MTVIIYNDTDKDDGDDDLYDDGDGDEFLEDKDNDDN